MQPLRSLTFIRIGSANSHKYVPNKKQLRAFRNICNKINTTWKELGIEYNIVEWKNNVYDKGWSYKKGIEYYKGKIASQDLIKYKNDQEDLIDNWIENNKELFDSFIRYRKYTSFSKTSDHSPPQSRGLYAFPQHRLETFLTHWDEAKFNIKIKKDGTSCRMRAKKFITIKYNKPTLWCHFIEEAKQLKVDIKINKYWVLINSCDYLNVLTLWEKNRTKQIRKEMGKNRIVVKHCYPYSSKDDLEVFLVGV